MPDDELKPKKVGLDPGTRALLGRQLRDYYDRMRQTTVSDSLAQLLQQVEIGTAQGGERPSASQADAASNRG
jgi:hypothetical protein